MSDNTKRPQRAARIVTATLVAGGIALVGGSAYAANSTQEAPAAAPLEPSVAAPVADPVIDPAAEALDAYFAAGYTYDDAVALGAQWNLDPFEAKAAAGDKLIAGETLPVAPGSSAPEVDPVPDGQMDAVDAFFAAGYDYDDAVALGELWNLDSWEAKIAGGEKLIAGETLPVAP